MAAMDLAWTIGDRITKARKTAGMRRVEDLAARIGAHRNTVSSWENDRTVPSLEAMRRIAVATGAPLGWLLGLNGAAADQGVADTRRYERHVAADAVEPEALAS
jgi:transcriptional regulator with XRE-family HTH domain